MGGAAMSRRRILIVGGSDAGTSAALSARAADPECEIDVLLEDRFPNFSVCGIPFLLSAEVASWRDLAHRSEEDFESRRIKLHKQRSVVSIRHDRREAVVATADGETAFEYDRLVIATGAEAVTPRIPGAELDGVQRVRTMDDGLAVLARIDSSDAKTVAVVGGGYIGVELADAFRRRGIGVTLVESAAQPLKTLDPQLGALVAEELRNHDVRISAATRVERIEPGPADGRRVLRLLGTDGFEVEAELVILCVGVRPRTALADAVGCERGVTGATRVTRRMETTVEGVFAAGDCVETWHRLLDRPVFLPLGTTAHKQGAVAGANAAGTAGAFAGTLGTQVVKIFDLAAGRTGLTGSEALKEGFEARTTEIVTPDHKAYYPGARPLHIRLTGDARDGRLLGAQIVGDYRASVAKRLDVMATALFNRLGVAEILDLDLSYTPPLGSPWDPWQLAARAWCDQRSADHSALQAQDHVSV
jgi:NADPH-dependent 2,4-dienoyl-CoA reductase/sulfur reductase-like enzyme